MNKQIKLVKFETATRYVINLNEYDFNLILNYTTLKEAIESYLIHELQNDYDCYLDIDHSSIILWIDVNEDFNSVRKNIETAISEYFRLASNYEYN